MLTGAPGPAAISFFLTLTGPPFTGSPKRTHPRAEDIGSDGLNATPSRSPVQHGVLPERNWQFGNFKRQDEPKSGNLSIEPFELRYSSIIPTLDIHTNETTDAI
jgi:hypothetical protein